MGSGPKEPTYLPPLPGLPSPSFLLNTPTLTPPTAPDYHPPLLPSFLTLTFRTGHCCIPQAQGHLVSQASEHCHIFLA